MLGYTSTKGSWCGSQSMPPYYYNPVLCNHTQRQLFIFQCINKMMMPNSSEAESCLKSLYLENSWTFIDELFNIILKLIRIKSENDNTHIIQPALIYIKYFVNQERQNLPDLTLPFCLLYGGLYNTRYKNMMIQCFKSIFNNKSNNELERNIFQAYLLRISKSLKYKEANQDEIMFIVEIFQDFNKEKQRSFHLSDQGYKIAKNIIQGYQKEKNNSINENLWVQFILILCNRSQLKPTTKFIIQHIASQSGQMYIKSYLSIYILLLKMDPTLFTLQQLQFLLKAQLQKANSLTFRENLREQGEDDQSTVTFLQTIKYLLKNIFQCIGVRQMEKVCQDFNDDQNKQFYRRYEIWSYIIKTCIQILYQNESLQLSMNGKNSIQSIITNYFKYLSQKDIIVSFTNQIRLELKQKQHYLYIFLTGMPKYILDYFNAEQILIHQSLQLSKISIQIRSINFNMFLLESFSNFVLKYLFLCQKKDDHTLLIKIDPFLQFLFSLQLQIKNKKYQETNYNSQQINKYNSNVVKLQAYAVSILASLLSHKPQPKIDDIETIICKIFNLFKIAYHFGGENQQDITETIIQSIQKLCSVQIYRSMAYVSVLNIIYQHLIPINQQFTGIDQKLRNFMLQQFLKILEECHDYQTQINIDQNEYLFQIFERIFSFEDVCLKDEACQFVLKILININLNKENALNVMQKIIPKLQTIKLFHYINQCFKKEEDLPLYCKILMQVLIFDKGKEIVYKILIDSCSSHDALTIQLNTDLIWQILMILTDVTGNQYTQKKGINQKVIEIKRNDIQYLMSQMSMDERSVRNNRTKWLDLKSRIQDVVDPQSIINIIVQNNIQQNEVQSIIQQNLNK